MKQNFRLAFPIGAILFLLATGCLAAKLSPVATISNHDNSGCALLCEKYGQAQRAGKIDSNILQEISGMAVSRQYPNILFVHNDSGDGPFIYAVSITGELLGKIKLEGADAVDWEDMDIGPCGKNECFYLGDIGDNGFKRKDCAIYQAVVPKIDTSKPFGRINLKPVTRFPIAYPDGPHNAEGLAVHPDGTVYVLSKEKDGRAIVFRFPALTPKAQNKPNQIGIINLSNGTIDKITAADFHPTGMRLLLRTYTAAYELPLESKDLTEDIKKGDFRLVPSAMARQNEAIAYDPFRGGYWHVSEGYKPYLYFVGCDKLAP